MTQPQTLNVEYSELMARADELDRPLPTIPSANPAAPCELSSAKHAVAQLALSADSMRVYLAGCEREWKSLAESLRKAAKAYEEVDEQAADAIAAEGGAPAAKAGTLSAFGDSDMPFDPPAPRPLPVPVKDAYYEVREAVRAIETGDQGAACRAFAAEWDAFQLALQEETRRFAPFRSWEGDARAAVEGNFEQQRQWIFSMVELCTQLSEQARQIADAQDKLRPPTGLADMDDNRNYVYPAQHPGPLDLTTCDAWYADGVRLPSPSWTQTAINWYATMQTQSETSLKIYETSTTLKPLTPTMFPSAAGLGSVIDGGSSGNLPDGRLPWDGDIPGTGDLPAGPGAGMPTMPSMPSMPSMPATPTDASAAAAAANGLGKSVGAGVKPASLGGGMGGGMPSMPSTARANLSEWPTGQGAAGGPGRAIPAAYAALGGTGTGGGMGTGGMGGGMPMGGQGKGDEGKGSKRVQGEEEALYTERRAWTEGIIGQRRAKTPPDREPVKKPAAYAALDA